MVFSLGVNEAMGLGELHRGMLAYWILHAGLLLSAGTVLVLLGGPLLNATFANLRRRRLTVEALFVLTAAGALAGSALATLTGEAAVYYEVVAFTLTIYSVGRLVTARTRQAALAESERTRQQYARAFVVTESGATVEAPVSSLRPGDIVAVQPGGLVTVDGVVLDGMSYIRETPLTGEPAPVLRGPGERVLAGSHAIDGALRVRVESGAGQRRLDDILSRVEDAQLRPSQLQVRADRISRWFVPVIAGISAVTFLAWLPAVGWTLALLHAMAVLLVACPCALGLATPVAVFSGLHGLSRLGLVARSGDFLDTLARCNAMAFDKTGTLSLSQLELTEWIYTGAVAGREALVTAATRLTEQGNPHPVAEPLSSLPEVPGEPTLERLEARLVPGKGVRARLSSDVGIEHEVAIGGPQLVLIPDGILATGSEGVTIGVALDGETVAIARFRESLRETSEAALRALSERGIALRILTGDARPDWRDLGGVALETGLTPADKEAKVKAWSEEGRTVVFVGDGVNDAPAMAHAAGAIAVDAGTDLARATAEGLLVGANLSTLPSAVDLARQVHRTVASNLWYALGYNLVGVSLAAAGILQPVVAVLIMLASSAFVSFRAVHAARLTEERVNRPGDPSFERLPDAPAEGNRLPQIRATC